jgi:RND superfamily putative drug exporter
MTDTYPPEDHRLGAHPDRSGPLARLAGLCFRRRGMVLLAWLLGLGLAIGLSTAFGGEKVNGASLPGSDSERAQTLLEERFPAQSGDRIDVAVRADDVASNEVRRRVGALLDQLRTMPHVVEVDDPYATQNAVSPDGRTLVARVYLDVANPNDMPVEATERLLVAASEAEGRGLEVALTGRAVQLAEAPDAGSTELLGLIAAAVVLLITFGSLVAAGLPLAVAIGGLLVSSSLVGITALVLDVPEFAPLIGAMLGIAVGIDYALLMVTRFREWRAVGLDPETATMATLDTAGRAVLVAGSTVVVSMAGLFAMGLSIMNGTAVVTMIAVLVVMCAALTLFPALLGYLGRWIDRLRLPVGRRAAPAPSADGHLVPARGWVRWSRLVQRHNALAAAGGITLLVVVALPFLGVQFALPDAGNDPEDRSARQGYDLLADGFGPGTSGPLLIVADLRQAEGDAPLERLHAALESATGVAAVSRPRVNAARDTALVTVIPATGPQDDATVDLVHTVRDDVIPVAVEGTGVQAYVGGRTATTIDVNSSVVDRLPFMIIGVVVVSMLLLVVAFRSIVIAATAAVMNLLSVAAAYGILALFLEGGWAGNLVGIDAPAPLAAYIPVIMFALLFGLSMDYEVFLVSRMRETWVRSRDNSRAVLAGLAGTGRVITAAASIMIVVFASLIALPDVTMKSFGIGMTAAVLVDATIVRMLLVPAVMGLLGRRNWWLPQPLLRWLPDLHVEGRPDTYLPAPDTQPRTPAPVSS